ncbi:hypothetical protein [Helicobacter fennelliae]|uniref:Uncharacterized protein n=1 Tax=Helicobacter fennelliae MRY12-0050 TaxID=1325130 RepID=T1D4D9_9HELI|nr:hypothetical protein [Helicobacter fennelliae]GAD20071.1 hypothetical protein HFN_1315 [Helicobacter fennelliae MRY12-0050]
MYKEGNLFYLDEKRARDELESDERLVIGILDKLAYNHGSEIKKY